MSYALVFVAEIGDKSQIMCMILAARYRALPVALGAILSFVLLNALAVGIGATIGELIAAKYVSLAVALLFLAFGLQSIFAAGDDENHTIQPISARKLFVTTFTLITVAEFGDKTQIAVLALGSSEVPSSIFIGATLALISTTVIAVWAGQRWLKQIPMGLVNKVSGVFFVVLGVVAAIKSYSLFTTYTQ